jgi:GNAT superfamily N-acetyltransferase
MQEGPVLVGSHAGRVVGTASAVQRESGIYVRGMAVVPEARGIGIGHLLLEEIEAFAKKHSAKRLFLSTTPFLTRAIFLYEKFVFRRTDEGPNDLCGTPLFTMEKPLAVVT